MTIPHITIEQAIAFAGAVFPLELLKIYNERIDKANAEQERPIITAEEARKLGAGKAEFQNDFGEWVICGEEHLNYVAKYRAIKQPEPVAIGMRDAIYKDSTPKLHVGSSSFEDWFQVQPFATQVGIKQMCRDSYAAGMGDPLVTYAAPSEPVEPHVELRAMYEQQVKDGTLDDYYWEYKFSTFQWLPANMFKGMDWSDKTELRCTPKPTCQIKNLDTNIISTMSREAAKKLQAKLGDTVEWSWQHSNGCIGRSFDCDDEDLLSFKLGGIYAYKAKPLKQVDWDNLPSGVAVKDLDGNIYIYCGMANLSDAVVLQSAEVGNWKCAIEIYKKDLTLATASKQPLIPVIAPPEGLTVEYSRFLECLRITGLAEGYELK